MLWNTVYSEIIRLKGSKLQHLLKPLVSNQQLITTIPKWGTCDTQTSLDSVGVNLLDQTC